jgi:hypothetical protein
MAENSMNSVVTMSKDFHHIYTVSKIYITKNAAESTVNTVIFVQYRHMDKMDFIILLLSIRVIAIMRAIILFDYVMITKLMTLFGINFPCVALP